MASYSLSPREAAQISQKATVPEANCIREAARGFAMTNEILEVLESFCAQPLPTPKISRSVASKVQIAYDIIQTDQREELSREFIMALVGAHRNLLQHASVQITYAPETRVIFDDILPRERLFVPLHGLIEEGFTQIVGTIEGVRFGGYIKIPDDGLYCAASFTYVATGSGAVFDGLEDRMARMQSKIQRGCRPMPSFIRSFRAVFDPSDIMRKFNRAPHRFPRVRSGKQLKERAQKYCAELDNFIAAVSHDDALCSFMHAACRCLTTPDACMHDYCKLHFGLNNISPELANEIASHLKTSLRDRCERELDVVRRMASDILPFDRSQFVNETIDASLHACNDHATSGTSHRAHESTSIWTFTSVGSIPFTHGSDFASPGGNEEVIVFELKYARISNMLRNVGFSLFGEYTRDTDLQWKEDHCLSAEQKILKDLASKMCLDSNSTVILKSGVLVFVTPSISRDVPEMLKQLSQQGHRVGQGVMLLSEHLVELVRNVLNPRFADLVKKGIFTPSPSDPKNTFFQKSPTGRVMILPGAPGGQYREQGLSAAKAVKTSQWTSAPDTTNQKGAQSQTDSIETRPTRSTGDLPKQPMISRPNTCDRQTRQPLKTLLKDKLRRQHVSPVDLPPSSGDISIMEELVHRQHDSPSCMPSSSADNSITSTVKTITKDSLKDLEITRHAHVRTLANMVIPKLEEAKVKGNSSAASAFLTEALASLQAGITLQEAEAFQKVVHCAANKRKTEKKELQRIQDAPQREQRKQDYEQWKEKYKKSGGNPGNDAEFFKDFM